MPLGLSFKQNSLYNYGGISPNKLVTYISTYNPLYYSNTGGYFGTGSTVYDLSPNKNNFTLNNTYSYSGGISFPGTNGYLVSNNLINYFSSFNTQTQELWFKNAYYNESGTNGVLLNEWGANAPNANWYYSQAEIIGQTGYIGVWNGSIVKIPVGKFIDGDWHCLSWKYDGTTLSGFVDGIKTNTINTSRQTPPNLYVGIAAGNTTNMGNGSYYKGLIGSYKLYNRVLNDNEVTQNYNYEKQFFINGITINGTLAGPNFAPYSSTNTQSPTNAPCWQLFYSNTSFSFTGVSQYVNTNGSNSWTWYYTLAPSAGSLNFSSSTVTTIGSDSRSYIANNFYTASVTRTNVPAGYYFMVGCQGGPYYKVFNSAPKDYLVNINGSYRYTIKNTCYWRTHGSVDQTMNIPTQIGGSGTYNAPNRTIWCIGLAGIN